MDKTSSLTLRGLYRISFIASSHAAETWAEMRWMAGAVHGSAPAVGPAPEATALFSIYSGVLANNMDISWGFSRFRPTVATVGLTDIDGACCMLSLTDAAYTAVLCYGVFTRTRIRFVALIVTQSKPIMEPAYKVNAPPINRLIWWLTMTAGRQSFYKYYFTNNTQKCHV